jgi:hypothetical protein
MLEEVDGLTEDKNMFRSEETYIFMLSIRVSAEGFCVLKYRRTRCGDIENGNRITPVSMDGSIEDMRGRAETAGIARTWKSACTEK